MAMAITIFEASLCVQLRGDCDDDLEIHLPMALVNNLNMGFKYCLFIDASNWPAQLRTKKHNAMTSSCDGKGRTINLSLCLDRWATVALVNNF